MRCPRCCGASAPTCNQIEPGARHEQTRCGGTGGGAVGDRHLRRCPGRDRAGGACRNGDEGGGPALGGGPEGDQLRHRRQRHPHREPLRLCRARGRDPGRAADGQRGDGREPPVLVGAAGHRQHRAEHPARRLRLRHRRRRRGDEPRRVPQPAAAQRRAHGRREDDRLDGGDADGSVRRRPHGHHRREPGGEVEHHARAAGRAGGRVAPARGGGDRGRDTSRARSCRSSRARKRATSPSTPTSM